MTSEGDEKTSARVETKMKDAPEILNFYINRLDFDRKTYKTIKLNDRFVFEKQLEIGDFTISEAEADFQIIARLSASD